MHSEIPEFAEMYNRRERIRYVATGLALFCMAFLLWTLWLLPAFTAFAATAHCRSVFGIAGTTLLWYGIFVAGPTFLALVFACMQGPLSLRILRDGRSPPIGAKVFRSTRIKRGAAARRDAYIKLLVIIPYLAISIWGFFQAELLSQQSQLKHPACTANYSCMDASCK